MVKVIVRKAKEALRLHFECGLGKERIARSIDLAKSTFSNYVYRFEKRGLTCPLCETLSEAKLGPTLFPSAEKYTETSKPMTDFNLVAKQLCSPELLVSYCGKSIYITTPMGFNFLNLTGS